MDFNELELTANKSLTESSADEMDAFFTDMQAIAENSVDENGNVIDLVQEEQNEFFTDLEALAEEALEEERQAEEVRKASGVSLIRGQFTVYGITVITECYTESEIEYWAAHIPHCNDLFIKGVDLDDIKYQAQQAIVRTFN